MQKTQAKEYIKEVLTSKFDKDLFTNFVRNILNDFEPKDNSYSGNLIPEAFRDHISHYRRIGRYEDPEGDLMDILIVQTKSVAKLERTRSALRNFVVRHLKTFDKNYALVAFYSKEDDGMDWRLSLVKIDYESNRGEDGRIKIQEDIVPAKRFSFLVGKNENSYTAQKQLLPLLINDRIEPNVAKIEEEDGSIEAAFSIQKVTDEFYEQYKDLFHKLTEDRNLTKTLQEQGLEPVRFVKKLLGQIVFLYFLQKKGWLGVPREKKMGEGSKRFIQDRFDTMPSGKTYFNSFLRHLFYEALAKEHHDQGVKYYIEKLDCKIPFLNGGLFEAEYDWENVHLNIPNELFRNDERKGDDKGTGILDVFDRYNFTIKEDEPLEKEVAVDPEMLGKVFENMLEVKERKSKGAFYTPREIVHYMCQESLIHYLDSSINEGPAPFDDSNEDELYGKQTNSKREMDLALAEDRLVTVPKEELEQFIRHGHLILENDTTVSAKGKETRDYKYQLDESTRINADALDKALANVKICDPAIGSGAFPVGILHEIVTARKVLVPYLSSSYVSKLQTDSGFKDSDNFPSDYYFKRHAIQESIYGADIDASAIDIARLRLWLSMIVDEEDYGSIEALPNLDYKIVCGNSLIGIPKNEFRDWKKEDELQELKEKFFHETNENEKKDLRNEINFKLRELLDSAEEFAGYKIDFDFSLFFSEVWHQKGGFDIVVGNPPYIQLQDKEKIPEEITAVYEAQNFNTFTKSGDIYGLFYEKGLNLTNSETGFLSFITSNRFCFTNYGEKLRAFLSTKQIVNLINLNKVEIFKEANVGTIIVNVKNKNLKKKQFHVGEFQSYNTSTSFLDQLKTFLFKVDSVHFNSEQWTFYDNKTLNLKRKILLQGKPLSKVEDLTIKRGITTGKNNVFVLPKDKGESLFKSQRSYEVLKPVFKGAEIKRWKCRPHKNFIFYTYTGIPIKNYPEVLDYLSQYKNVLSNVYEAKKGQKKWYELRKCSYYDLFLERKIIWTRLSNINSFAISEGGEFSIDSTSFAVGKNLEFYCTILNSTVVRYYFTLGGVIWGKDGIKWFGDYFDKIPVLTPSSLTEKIFNNTIDYLYTLTEKENLKHQMMFFEELVDAAVFQLYFTEEFNKAQKEILEHLKELPSLKHNSSEEEHLAIINSVYQSLSQVEHPVKKHLDSLEEIEEVRLIREALK